MRVESGGGGDEQLVGSKVLHAVAGLRVEDEEERLVAEVANLRPCRRWLHVVARREVELGLDVEGESCFRV